jgi:hypothetical protein
MTGSTRASGSTTQWLVVMGDNIDTNPERPVEEILDQVRAGAALNLVPRQVALGTVVAPFSALLVRLSRDAERTASLVNKKTQQLIVLTRWLIALTVVIILLTAPLVFVEVAKYISELSQPPLDQQEHDSSARQHDQQSNGTNKTDNREPPINTPTNAPTSPSTPTSTTK